MLILIGGAGPRVREDGEKHGDESDGVYGLPRSSRQAARFTARRTVRAAVLIDPLPYSLILALGH